MTAIRLASTSALRWRRANWRICAQLSCSGMRPLLQPAPQQWCQRLQRLIAVGQQGQAPATLGQQSRKAGDAEMLDPGEIGSRRRNRLCAVEGGSEFAARESGLPGQLHQQCGTGDVTPIGVEGLLDQLQQRPDPRLVQALSNDQCTTGRLGVVDKTLW